MAKMKMKTVRKAQKRANREKAKVAIRKLEIKAASAKDAADRAEIEAQIALLKYARDTGRAV